ncbi:Aldo/keto reductase [Marasmius fiardii PR-910]|nr:Aldo/keto reductase [Marasmius fiardii PR-910]
MSAISTRTIRLNNGQEMPMISFGTWAPPTGTAREDAWRWILTALKAGYRHLDTANGYGTEKAVGRALKESGLKREEVYITTKLPFNHVTRVKESFNESLTNLDMDYVDLYLIHFPQSLPYQESDELVKNPDGTLKTLETPTFVDVWAEMEEILESGKAKAIGVSNFSVKTLEILLKNAKVVPCNNQVENHPYLQQNDLRDYCKEKGITLSAYTPSGWDHVRSDPVIVELAQKYGVSPHQVILAWHLARDMVVVTVSKDEGRQKDNLNLPTLSEEDVLKINKLDRGERICNKADEKGLCFGWTLDQLGW